MKKVTYTILIAASIILMASSAFATDGIYRMRAQADSEFRIAEKAYRKAIREYGDSMEGLPAKEKASACRKMSSALHDNRKRANFEDAFTQPRYRRQVQKLEEYSNAFGCTK